MLFIASSKLFERTMHCVSVSMRDADYLGRIERFEELPGQGFFSRRTGRDLELLFPDGATTAHIIVTEEG